MGDDEGCVAVADKDGCVAVAFQVDRRMLGKNLLPEIVVSYLEM